MSNDNNAKLCAYKIYFDHIVSLRSNFIVEFELKQANLKADVFGEMIMKMSLERHRDRERER